MRTILAALVAILTSLSLASAQQPSASTIGRSLAATCANCHGTSGVSVGDMPSLAGASKDDIVRKMQAFKSGALAGTVMPQLAKGFSDEQIDAVAAWFAAQKSPR